MHASFFKCDGSLAGMVHMMSHLKNGDKHGSGLRETTYQAHNYFVIQSIYCYIRLLLLHRLEFVLAAAGQFTIFSENGMQTLL